MLKLRLENSLDIIDLDEQATTGWGVQAVTRASGLGLPPVSTQWLEGAGDGARYRGKRVQVRDIDLPLDIKARNRDDLKQLLDRLALMLADECELIAAENDGTTWSTSVVRVGGGDYVFGEDTTGETDFSTVITLRAGDPYFTSSVQQKKVVQAQAGTAFLDSLAAMPVASSQTIGTITLENTGTAKAYPLWRVYGPGHDFKAVSSSGETLWWKGTLAAGETLIVDAQTGSVTDGTGANRYAELATAPRFWSVPPGTTSAEASLLGTTTDSKIEVTWRPRKWMVV